MIASRQKLLVASAFVVALVVLALADRAGQEHRLRRSLELLDQGETDILDVALRVGFCSHSHSRASFTRPSASRRPRSRRASGRSGNRAWPASAPIAEGVF